MAQAARRKVGFIERLLSDLLASTYGAESLRYSLTVMTFSSLLAAACFWVGSKYLVDDLKKQHS